MTPLEPAALALRQVDDPAFVKVAAASVLGAIAGFALLGAGVSWGLHGLLGGSAWLAWLAGSIGTAMLAYYLFLPVAGAVATIFTDVIAAAVERRFYSALPPARPAALGAQIWDGLVLGFWVVVLQVAALLASPLLPGISLLAGYVIAAWAIGRGLFVAVAMRRMDRSGARALYAARRGAVLTQGGLAVAASLVPVVNLLVPVLVVAAMVHILNEGDVTAGRAGPRGGWPGLAGGPPV